MRILIARDNWHTSYGWEVINDLSQRLENVTYGGPKKIPACDAILVVEATLAGSAMYTAQVGLEEGKTVLAVPGNIFSYMSQGTNLLIQNGVPLVTNYQDVLDFLPNID